MTEAFSVTGDDHGSLAVVRLAGEFDLAAKPLFSAYMSRLLTHAGATSIDIDLTGLTFLDSTGIGALVEVRNHVDRTGQTVRAYGARGMVAEVLLLTGVATLLNIDAPNEYMIPAETEHHGD